MLKYIKEIELGLLIRLVETRLLDLFKEGLINGTVHTCVGQELTGAFIAKHLTAEDYVFSNHRGHGHFISRTGKVKELLLELMGKKNGACHGIGGSQHLYDHNYLSNGIQAGMTPIAAGVALHYKVNKTSDISVVFIGDGTLGEGLLYETLNICGKWNLPVLFVLENNKYAQSTSWQQTFSGNLEDRIKGFGVNYSKADIWDLDHLDNCVNETVAKVREGKPYLLEIDCYRLNSHSKGDDNRSEIEITAYREKDPINTFIRQYSQLAEEIKQKHITAINNWVEAAKQEEDLDYLENLPQVHNLATAFSSIETTTLSKEKYNTLIYHGLKSLLQNGHTFMIGEDIANNSDFTAKPYGGAFKVTRDLSDLYPNRVFNTPISEAAIAGISIGLAVKGNIAIAEIMFGDFSTLVLDQLLQHASKFYGMTKGNIKVPFILRTPMGGYRGYGPTHSQSIEKHFLGIPYLNVIALNKYLDPSIIYTNLSKEPTPSMVIENKILYTRTPADVNKVFNYQISDELYPTILISPRSAIRDCTIVCYGGMVEIVEKAILELIITHDIFCEIIIPSKINTLNIEPILNSVEATEKLLIVEEGSNIASLSGTIVSGLLQQTKNSFLYQSLANNNIIPSGSKAEISLLPSAQRIVKSILSFFRNQ